ncbi:MAG TPA: HIRAN domain-containing protein [Pseudolabrys sp.]|nr:HIRAN domain-containing protein [Pseudolabrys sp.]
MKKATVTTDGFSRREVNRALLVTAFALLTPGARAIASETDTPLFDFAIAGGAHHGLYLDRARDTLALGERLLLRAEPENPYDANAIAVHRRDGLMLGYMPRYANEPIAALLAEGARIDAEVVERLHVRDGEETPDDLAFTFFLNGDPRIRLTLRGRPATNSGS